VELSRKDIENLKKRIPKVIGKNIRDVRENKGMTQTTLSNLVGSDRQYLYKIEHAKVGVSVVKLIIIAKALEVDVADLLVDCTLN